MKTLLALLLSATLASGATESIQVDSTTRNVKNTGIIDYAPGQLRVGDLPVDPTVSGGGGTGGITNVPVSKTLFVDVAGVNATATRGSLTKPYLTITKAVTDAQAGDLIKVGPGIFVEEVQLPDNVSIDGAGSEQTKITFTSLVNGATLKPGVNSNISNICLENTAAPPTITAGFLIPAEAVVPPTNVVLYNVKIRGYSDGVFMSRAGATMKAFNCQLYTNYDSVQIRKGTAEFFNCTTYVDGAGVASPSGLVRGIACDIGGTTDTGLLRWLGGSITAINGTIQNTCVYAKGRGNIEIQNALLVNGSTASFAYDLEISGAGTTGAVIKYSNLTKPDGTPLRILIPGPPTGIGTVTDISQNLNKGNNLSDVGSPAAALNNILPSQTGQAGKVLGTNGTTASWSTSSGAGNAFVEEGLDQFASTTSEQLAGVISDEVGTGGGFVRATAPTLSDPTFTGVVTAATINAALLNMVGAGTNVTIATTTSAVTGIGFNTSTVTSAITPVAYSPALTWTGAAWNGTQNRSVRFQAMTIPVATGGTPTGYWQLGSQIQTGPYINVLKYFTNGNIQPATGYLSSDGSAGIDVVTGGLTIKDGLVTAGTITGGGGGGGGAWGTITGDITTQGDLQDALGTKQPVNPNLTSLSAASTDNAIYYRSATEDVWAPVTIGANLTFTGGTLSATGGGGGGGGATIPNVTNLIAGSGTGNGADSGIAAANVALLSGAQTIGGAKTFTSAPTISTGTADAFVKFSGTKNLVAAVAGTDYTPVTGTISTGKVVAATGSAAASWQFPIAEVNKSGAYTLGTTNSRELYGGIIRYTAAGTLTLPTASTGQYFTVMVIGPTDFVVNVDPNAADTIVLDGMPLNAGDKITSPGVHGDMVVCSSRFLGWDCMSNGWTDTD